MYVIFYFDIYIWKYGILGIFIIYEQSMKISRSTNLSSFTCTLYIMQDIMPSKRLHTYNIIISNKNKLIKKNSIFPNIKINILILCYFLMFLLIERAKLFLHTKKVFHSIQMWYMYMYIVSHHSLKVHCNS
jgi:uncharacterized protein with PQ loop repeat